MYLRPIAPGRPRIVVLDHDAPSLSRLCGLLQSNGYLTFSAESAPLACRALHRRQVDLVLTTIALPEADRREWIAALGNLAVNVPVVAMCEASSVYALDLFDTANEFGAAAMLRRPFTTSTLLQVISQLLPAAAKNETAVVKCVPAHVDWPGLASGSSAIH
jgi:DNA-binding NtrC family response regulator